LVSCWQHRHFHPLIRAYDYHFHPLLCPIAIMVIAERGRRSQLHLISPTRKRHSTLIESMTVSLTGHQLVSDPDPIHASLTQCGHQVRFALINSETISSCLAPSSCTRGCQVSVQYHACSIAHTPSAICWLCRSDVFGAIVMLLNANAKVSVIAAAHIFTRSSQFFHFEGRLLPAFNALRPFTLGILRYLAQLHDSVTLLPQTQ